jgi:hypothetical protein
MIRVDHLTLPAGLRAIAQRAGRGELYVVVSDELDPAAQRAAVRTAVRAARRHAWEFGFLPLPAAAAVPALGTGARHLFRVLRAHLGVSALTGSIAAGAATAAIFVMAVPQPPGHPGAIAPRSPGYTQSAGTGSRGAPGGSQPGAPGPGQSSGTAPRVVTIVTPKTKVPHPGPAPQPATTSAAAPAQTQPPSTSSPAQPQPTTTTSSSSPPSSGGGGGKTCVYLLGVLVCL